MKKYIISIAFLIFFAYSCTEEPIGQYPVDETSPQMISNPVVTNFKGGATIKYELPGDKDLLCIKAVYTLPTGEKKEKLASAYIDELTIEGFAKATKTSVSLIAVDKSRNESAPVVVEIEPLDSPIFDIYSSLSVIASFGGLKLTWENPEKNDIVVGVVAKNEEDVFVSVENFYTSVSSGLGTVRGLEAKETEFGIFIRDIYNNYTDTLFTVITPWEESELDKGLWKGMPLCSSYTLSQYGGAISVLWNGVTLADGYGCYYINRTSSDPIFFTLDLGVSAKFSRFKFWGRNEWYFNLHHPKEFEVWGTNDPNVANGGACSWDGWELLLSGTSTKPSGDDATSFANLTSEDLALAYTGEEFEFSLDVPAVRYIRFKTIRTWTDSNSSFVSELTFWGQVNE
ncbi:DUF5000 domain-containing lipoprotein [Maribellus sp. YY47]|uniref:DUF5000 domain-containing lipoprotein n=1 Tax=Maribellus sp. YY47 TaxID=2929486 RepID=UPI0020008B73|nr:DUF5000 domain-containing lipoprotein [Maribellus sp. YY47]MCK3683905.1 DUF4959 domain-containing protein [Maribellus sp. YY47]